MWTNTTLACTSMFLTRLFKIIGNFLIPVSRKKKYLSNQTIKGVSVYELRYVFVLIHDIRRNCYFFFKFSWTLRRGTKSMFLSLSRDKIKTLAPLRDAHESCQKQHVVFKLIHFTWYCQTVWQSKQFHNKKLIRNHYPTCAILTPWFFSKLFFLSIIRAIYDRVQSNLCRYSNTYWNN